MVDQKQKEGEELTKGWMPKSQDQHVEESGGALMGLCDHVSLPMLESVLGSLYNSPLEIQ